MEEYGRKCDCFREYEGRFSPERVERRGCGCPPDSRWERVPDCIPEKKPVPNGGCDCCCEIALIALIACMCRCKK